MRLIKKSMAVALVVAMAATMAPVNNADAARKPKLNKSKVSIKVGEAFKII